MIWLKELLRAITAVNSREVSLLSCPLTQHLLRNENKALDLLFNFTHEWVLV